MIALETNQIGRRTLVALLALSVVFGGLILTLSRDASGASGERWYEITLKAGEIDGYLWAAGAKLPRHKALSEICATTSLIEPLEPGSSYVEGTSGAVCGKLATPMESMTGSSSFGSGESRVAIFIALYRPAVRKVVFRFEGTAGTGTKVFRPRIAKVPNRQSKGIPRFRYFAAPFKGETCIRKVTLFDGSGDVIYSEPSPACRDGGNL